MTWFLCDMNWNEQEAKELFEGPITRVRAED